MRVVTVVVVRFAGREVDRGPLEQARLLECDPEREAHFAVPEPAAVRLDAPAHGTWTTVAEQTGRASPDDGVVITVVDVGVLVVAGSTVVLVAVEPVAVVSVDVVSVDVVSVSVVSVDVEVVGVVSVDVVVVGVVSVDVVVVVVGVVSVDVVVVVVGVVSVDVVVVGVVSVDVVVVGVVSVDVVVVGVVSVDVVSVDVVVVDMATVDEPPPVPAAPATDVAPAAMSTPHVETSARRRAA